VIVPYRIAVTYFLLDRHQDVAKVCEDLIKNADRFAPAYFIRGMAELEQERFEAARSDLEKSVSLEPQSALSHREMGNFSLTEAAGYRSPRRSHQCLRELY
jgi:tetratricopeptide (TPR) repeat protein